MKAFGVLHMTTVHNIEAGDEFALKAAGGVSAGKIVSVHHAAYSLGEEEKAHMIKHGLTIPEDVYEPLGGVGSCLIFFTSTSAFRQPRELDHIFMGYDHPVVVFNTV